MAGIPDSSTTGKIDRFPQRCAHTRGFGQTRRVKGNSEFTAVLGWPGYQVYRHAIDEQQKHLTLWVRRKRGNRKLTCPSCGRRVSKIHDVYERKRQTNPSVPAMNLMMK